MRGLRVHDGAWTALAAVLWSVVVGHPATAQAWCTPDAAHDVRGMPDGTAAPAAADVREACAGFGDLLTLQVQLAAPDDPATSGAWRGDTQVVWTLRADAPDSVHTSVVRMFRDDDDLVAYVYERPPAVEGVETLRCPVPAAYQDGLFVVGGIPVSCLTATGQGQPTRVAYEVAYRRDTDTTSGNGSAVTVDEAPETATVLIQRGPTTEPRDTHDTCDGAPEDGAGDVPEGSAHEAAIDCITWWGVTRGTGDGGYAPGHAVTRGQMASFVAAALERSGVRLPTSPPDAFDDDDGTVHEHRIDQLRAVGVVSGVGTGRYAPHAPVTRAQMAAFLVRAWQEASGTTMRATADYFPDDDGHPLEADIDRAAEAGFVVGTGGRYAPRASVSRAQMASFLVRLLDAGVEGSIATPPS